MSSQTLTSKAVPQLRRRLAKTWKSTRKLVKNRKSWRLRRINWEMRKHLLRKQGREQLLAWAPDSALAKEENRTRAQPWSHSLPHLIISDLKLAGILWGLWTSRMSRLLTKISLKNPKLGSKVLTLSKKRMSSSSLSCLTPRVSPLLHWEWSKYRLCRIKALFLRRTNFSS